MSTHSMPTTTWHTASFADHLQPTSVETSALGAHLDVCKRYSGSWFKLQRGAELVNGFLAGRFITTLALIAVVIGLSSLVI